MKINKRYYVYVGVIAILIVGIISINMLSNDNNSINSNIALYDETITTKDVVKEEGFYVDIKGAVKKPGVYQVTADMIVNDLIKLAGGLNKNAYTKNINLASKLKEGMVVYIYNKSETNNTTNKIVNDITCTTEVIKYDEKTTTEASGLININTASKDALMTLTGIGESKAIAIIEYRNKTPFNTIEDIMNVSGIGESAFAKIKSNITV